ncbi:MAG TPA: hypothetical protein VJ577_08200 [Burkholderiaceae bacterium]|nr:hypothetical protein [Burkholderiaceae bacterium]
MLTAPCAASGAGVESPQGLTNGFPMRMFLNESCGVHAAPGPSRVMWIKVSSDPADES